MNSPTLSACIGAQMQIDLHAINPELLNYLKDSVSTMSESELVIRDRGLKEPLPGLKQDNVSRELGNWGIGELGNWGIGGLGMP